MFSLLNLFIALGALIFTYYKFFREGEHQQRIEFDIDFVELGNVGDYRIIEVGITAENKGNVEQKFERIDLKIRGIKDGLELHEIINHEPRLSFPEDLPNISVISKKYLYFFVRPGVVQRFPVVLKVPLNWNLIHTRSTFKYFGVNDIHNAERAFKLTSR